MATVRHFGLFSLITPDEFNENLVPFCPTQVAAGSAGFDEGIWLSPYYATAAYWRAKRWRVSYDITWFVTGTTPAPFYQEFTYSNNMEVSVGQYESNSYDPDTTPPPPWGEAYSVETRLICGRNSVQPQPDNPDSVINSLFLVRMASGILTAGGRISSTTMEAGYSLNFLEYKINNGSIFYRMPLSPSGFFYTASNGSGGLSSASASSQRATQSDAFKLRLLGEEFTCDIYTQIRSNTEVLSIEVILEATEYWPYDPEDGLGPIYDSATGAQLRPFPQ
jgi:hypothetical protein